MSAGRAKHIPMRTCVACRQERPKRELVRVVRTASGTVDVDPTGKKAGRGAYLCPAAGCWEGVLKRRGLDSVLKTALRDEDLARLQSYCTSLPATPGGEGVRLAPEGRQP